MTAGRVALCGLCGEPMSGSRLLLSGDMETDAAVIGSVYLIHVIDKHWDFAERIRATTGDGAARLVLNEQIRRERAAQQ